MSQPPAASATLKRPSLPAVTASCLSLDCRLTNSNFVSGTATIELLATTWPLTVALPPRNRLTMFSNFVGAGIANGRGKVGWVGRPVPGKLPDSDTPGDGMCVRSFAPGSATPGIVPTGPHGVGHGGGGAQLVTASK